VDSHAAKPARVTAIRIADFHLKLPFLEVDYTASAKFRYPQWIINLQKRNILMKIGIYAGTQSYDACDLL
jgi:hypothetical protein